MDEPLTLRVLSRRGQIFTAADGALSRLIDYYQGCRDSTKVADKLQAFPTSGDRDKMYCTMLERRQSRNAVAISGSRSISSSRSISLQSLFDPHVIAIALYFLDCGVVVVVVVVVGSAQRVSFLGSLALYPG